MRVSRSDPIVSVRLPKGLLRPLDLFCSKQSWHRVAGEDLRKRSGVLRLALASFLGVDEFGRRGDEAGR